MLELRGTGESYWSARAEFSTIERERERERAEIRIFCDQKSLKKEEEGRSAGGLTGLQAGLLLQPPDPQAGPEPDPQGLRRATT